MILQLKWYGAVEDGLGGDAHVPDGTGIGRVGAGVQRTTAHTGNSDYVGISLETRVQSPEDVVSVENVHVLVHEYNVLQLREGGECQEFGTSEQDYMHFSPFITTAILELEKQFPADYAQYYEGYAKAVGDKALAERRELINPMSLIGSAKNAAGFFRIRVGACDADTAFTISMALALKLAQAGKSVDYALVWDRPRCQADYPNEVCDWIEAIVKI